MLMLLLLRRSVCRREGEWLQPYILPKCNQIPVAASSFHENEERQRSIWHFNIPILLNKVFILDVMAQVRDSTLTWHMPLCAS